MRANTFVVEVSGTIPVITSGIPVSRTETGWRVPLGECFGCGEDVFLAMSCTNPPVIVSDDDSPTGKVMQASVVECKGQKKLRKPDDNAVDLRAVVMLMHFDEFSYREGSYEIVKQGTGILLELYRGGSVEFRCPRNIDRFRLSYDGQALSCIPLGLDSQPDAVTAAVESVGSVAS